MFSISNDLWPYPEELGFDFLKDVWQKIPSQLQERLAAAQSMYLASFNFEEIVAGRTEIRHYSGGRNPREFWPQWIIESELITNTVLAFFHPNRDPFGVSFGVGPHLVAATYGGLGIEEAERADMALSYVFEEQLHGGTLTLNRALSDGLTSTQHAARLTDWLAGSEDWPGPWLFNGDTFTAAQKTAYEALVLTARKKLGHKGHTEAVRRIAVALGIDFDQAASVLGRRGHAGAVRRIAMVLGLSEKDAASELGRRGHAGAVRSIAAALGIDLKEAASELGRRGTATLEGYDTGTHISKGRGKTPKGGLTIACKDRPDELGRLKQSCGQLESKETFEANIAGYSLQGRIPRDDSRNYGKPKIEFSEEEKEEYRLAIWIKDRKKIGTKLQNRLEAYKKEHPDENDCVSELLDDVRERLVKVTKTWNAKRKRN